MLHDIRALHDITLQSSHNGRPVVVSKDYSSGRGRPRTVIDRDFLAWAYRFRTTSGIASFLGVSRTVVRQALLDYNIAPAGANPFPRDIEDDQQEQNLPEFIQGSSRDHVLQVPSADTVPEFAQGSSHNGGMLAVDYDAGSRSPPAGYLSSITDLELDTTVRRLRQDFPRAGISILDGMLRNSNITVQRERIRTSLLRIDPVERIFDRVRLKRRGYHVPGPNSLWHHDGQHGV